MERYRLLSCCLLTLVSMVVILSASELRDTDRRLLPRHAPKHKPPAKPGQHNQAKPPHHKKPATHHPKPRPPKPPPHSKPTHHPHKHSHSHHHHTHHPKPPPHSKPTHHPHKHSHSHHHHHHHTKPTPKPPCQPVNCIVEPWSRWNRCSVPCGTKGIQQRTRQVTTNAACGGICPYELRETRRCNYYCINGGTLLDNHCHCFQNFGGDCCEDVHGRWGCWGDWAPCSVTCGSGTRQRRRTCTYPPPANNGRECTGSNMEIVPCEVTQC